MKATKQMKKEMVAEMFEIAFISPEELGRRWCMSRNGAVRLAEEAGVASIRLGGPKSTTRRFRLADIQAHEDRAATITRIPDRKSSQKKRPLIQQKQEV